MPDVPPVAGERTWTIIRERYGPERDFGVLMSVRGPHTGEEGVEVVELSRLRAAEEERNRWVRLFNRLDAAISHHRKGKGSGACYLCGSPEGRDHSRRCGVVKQGAPEKYISPFADDADDALHAAHDRILKEAAGSRTGAVKVEADMQDVVAERDRLADALNRIADENTHPEDCGAIACEALASLEGGDE